jgi:ABC-2 type transport system ATP-binding protein
MRVAAGLIAIVIAGDSREAIGLRGSSGCESGSSPDVHRQGKADHELVIEVRQLVKCYGRTVAVAGLDFDIRPGVVTGFLGPNGAGKSTTMRMILGLDAPTSGTARIDGRDYRSMHRPLYEVGAVLDARAVHGGRSVFDHVLCLAQSNGIGRRRVHEVLELVGLSDVAGRRARGLSLGMSQRLGLAAALLGDPGVLLCDEPVNGLDPEGIRWIRTLLRGLAEEGRTVFVSSHLMSEMALTADHVVVIGRGRLLADCPIADLPGVATGSYACVRTADPTGLRKALGTNADVVIGADGALEVRGMAMPAIGEAAARAGIVLHELSAQQASLESAFLDLTAEAVDYHGATR